MNVFDQLQAMWNWCGHKHECKQCVDTCEPGLRVPDRMDLACDEGRTLWQAWVEASHALGEEPTNRWEEPVRSPKGA